MKKIITGVSILVIFCISYILLNYGLISPTNDILGCYIAQINTSEDKVCLLNSGRYEQYYRTGDSREKKYNSAGWKQFSYTADKTQFMAGTLNQFIIIDDKGAPTSTFTLDIQVNKNTLGQVNFVIGNQYSKKRRVYFKE